eukprot:jgi/Chrzof1/6432/Cz18g10140.t1
MSFRTVFLGRQPPPKDLIDRSLYALGSLLRAAGVALDSVGSVISGPYAAAEKLTPNIAWLPYPVESGEKQQQPVGQQLEVPNPPLYPHRYFARHPDLPEDLKLKIWGKPLPEIPPDAPKVQIVEPQKGQLVFVAPNATLLGDIKLGDMSSVWYGAVLRGDVNSIIIGDKTNIQDNVVIHCARESIDTKARPTIVGDACTIGHGATIHACTIGNECLIGMGATVLDGVVLENNSMVAAGAVVTPGSVIKSGEIWAGSPAKLLRTMSDDEQAFVAESAERYVHLAMVHRTENSKAFEEVYLDKKIIDERSWRERSDIDVHQGIFRDPETELILSMR